METDSLPGVPDRSHTARKLLSSLAIASLLLNGCMKPQVMVKHAPREGERLRVAILPFKDAPNAPGSGEMAAEAMLSHLLNVPAYELIERSALEQIVAEQKLSVTGAIDPHTASSLGKLLGADAIVVGAVTQYQKRNFMILPPAKVTVNARLVRTESGTVDWSGSYTLGWHPIKWAMCFFWPLGVVLVMTSPSAEDRAQKAVKVIAGAVRDQSKSAK